MFFSVLKNTCASSNNTWQRHHSRTPHILLFYTCVKGQDDDEVLEREEKLIKTKSKKKVERKRCNVGAGGVYLQQQKGIYRSLFFYTYKLHCLQFGMRRGFFL